MREREREGGGGGGGGKTDRERERCRKMEQAYWERREIDRGRVKVKCQRAGARSDSGGMLNGVMFSIIHKFILFLRASNTTCCWKAILPEICVSQIQVLIFFRPPPLFFYLHRKRRLLCRHFNIICSNPE